MSQSHTGHQSDASKAAMHEQDQINIEKQRGLDTDAVPPAENGSHAHSSAAHLKLDHDEHTKPEGNLRHGSHPGALREPPMVTQRVGKEHK
jgi:hypothetical protein